MRKNEYIIKTNEQQIAFGLLLGLNLKNYTIRVAKAMIDDEIEEQFYMNKRKMASKKQIELGNKFGLDFTELSLGVASANIKDLMIKLNLENIEKQDIKPGDRVVSKYDKNKIEFIVSSIGRDGYLYYKKPGSGASARY